MTYVADRQSLGTAEIANKVWNRRPFVELIELIGAPKANELVERFRSDLRNRFADPVNRALLRRDAQAVISTSAFLGFAPLSRAAKRLETACETDELFEGNLQALTIARFNAICALNDWIASKTEM